MTYVSIPLQAVANQSLEVILNDKRTTINLKTTDHGLFIDVSYDGGRVVNSGLCRDRVNINRASWLGMPDALWFADLQGTSDPVFSGFGKRFLLLYGTPDSTSGVIA